MTTDETALSVIEEQADASIRRIWHDGRWFFSVIDLIGVLTDSARPRKYWSDLKKRLIDEEGFSELSAKIGQLKMRSADGKFYRTDAADTETLLRIIQSVPSPKAEPVKQWLAREGAKRLDEATRPIDAAQTSTEIATSAKPATDAPALAWAEYHEHLAVLYRRQAAYEAHLARLDERLDQYEDSIGELHSRMESLEEGQRLLPELLERLGPQTLTPEHQATVKAVAGRLHDLAGYSFAAIYGDLNAAFHVGKYSDIPDALWTEVAEWLQRRVDAAERQRKH
jgi:BRO family, N-terminal domain